VNSFRVAVAGKGGAGKTTLSATLARLLARRGRRVLVIDADSNPNVAIALGLERERAAAIVPLPTGLVSRRLGGPALSEPVAEVVARHGTLCPDAVAVVHMAMPAHADEGCLCSSHATVSAMLADAAGEPGTAVVVDLEASPEHFSRGTTRHVDTLLLVVEPYYRSLETARRMALLAAELPIARVAVVANKLRVPADADAVAEFCARHGLDLEACLPWSDEVLEADRAGSALIDHDPAGAYVAAVTRLSDSLLESARLGAPA
jgi:CO dehydrogenase maturation factor